MSKSLVRILPPGPSHWVGDGFPVRTAFTYQNAGVELSPFLMLDHGGPTHFEPTVQRRGVGEHPHRGFETVTLVVAGEVDHRDSHGGGGSIGPGDVQWMTAGSGIVHEEFHGRGYAQRGGPFEMVQLWVNLPARHKMTQPSYQVIGADTVSAVALDGGAGRVRLIAGDGLGARGAARTFTPLEMWDVELVDGASVSLPAHEGWGVGALVMAGAIEVQGRRVEQGGMAVFGLQGSDVVLRASGAGVGSGAAGSSRTTKLLWLSGEPIREPIAGYGPFVMNTKDEILQAMQDFQAGRMGTLEVRDRP
jgi:quercetin 2,3-dioxygenase